MIPMNPSCFISGVCSLDALALLVLSFVSVTWGVSRLGQGVGAWPCAGMAGEDISVATWGGR